MVVVDTFNPSTQEAEAGGSLQVWHKPGLQELVPGQLGLLPREPLSQKTKTKQNKTKQKKTIHFKTSKDFELVFFHVRYTVANRYVKRRD